jgi:hypothetical protein
MRPDAPYFSNLLCQTLDDFTPQVESAATQWVNETINEMLIGGGGLKVIIIVTVTLYFNAFFL